MATSCSVDTGPWGVSGGGEGSLCSSVVNSALMASWIRDPTSAG